MNSDKINSIIRKKARNSNDMSLHLHQMFFFERVLKRIEKSKYKDNIILKGGFLLSSIIGSDMRTTKDIDATLKGITLESNEIFNIFDEILSIHLDDGCTFKIESIKDILLDSDYGGFRINVFGTFDKLKTNFFIEVTTGDVITPREIKYQYNSIFSEEKINVLAYNLPTIIAEKFHAIVSKNITTTRFKDFYDIYIIMNRYFDNVDEKVLIKAIKRTFDSRNTSCRLDYLGEVIKLMENDRVLIDGFNRYRDSMPYVEGISYIDTINAIKEVVSILS